MQKLRAKATLLLVLTIFVAWLPRAGAGQSVGTSVRSPLLIAFAFGTSGGNYALVAHRLDEATAKLSLSFGRSRFANEVTEEIIVPSERLMIQNQAGVWTIDLQETFPTLGELHFRMASVNPRRAAFGGCGGFYEFYSPEGGLSRSGSVSGLMDGNEILYSACLSWGTDVTGFYFNPPLV